MDENQTTGTTPEGGEKKNMLPMAIAFFALFIVAVIAYVVMTKQTVAPLVETPMGAEEAGLTPESIPVGEADAAAAAISAQGTSDEVADIQADLNATDLKVLDGVDSI